MESLLLPEPSLCLSLVSGFRVEDLALNANEQLQSRRVVHGMVAQPFESYTPLTSLLGSSYDLTAACFFSLLPSISTMALSAKPKPGSENGLDAPLEADKRKVFLDERHRRTLSSTVGPCSYSQD